MSSSTSLTIEFGWWIQAVHCCDVNANDLQIDLQKNRQRDNNSPRMKYDKGSGRNSSFYSEDEVRGMTVEYEIEDDNLNENIVDTKEAKTNGAKIEEQARKIQLSLGFFFPNQS